MAAFWLLYAVVLLSAIALLLKAFSGTLNSPPGPKPWPIIGNLNLMGTLPHRSMHALSLKYGPIMQLRFGSIPVIVISSPEIAKQLLRTHDLTFAFRPRTAAGKHFFYDHSNITFSPYGPYWRKARKVCLTEIFSPKSLASFQYIRWEEVKSLLHDLFSMRGKALVLKEYISGTNLNIISRVVLGKKFLGDEEMGTMTGKELRKTVEEVFTLLGELNIGDYIPWLGFLDLQGYVKRMKAVAKRFDLFLEHVLKEHESRRDGGVDFVARDMVDVLLERADDADDAGVDDRFKRSRIKAFVLDMIAGGTDTSTITLEWAISELIKKPEAIKKAVEELDKVIGKDRWVEEKDIPQLPYMDAILKETMRLHPAAPLMVPHVSQADTTMAGYDIPIGTMAIVNVWALGRDASTWDMAEEFRPERFVGKEIDVKGQDFELLPFGSGRRMCPGYSLALKLLQLSLSNLLHGFVWRLPENTSAEKLDMEETFGLVTPRKIPITVVVDHRLPTNLYNL